MACVYHKCFVVACMLASMSLPILCTDEVVSTEIPENAAAEPNTIAREHTSNEMEESHGSRVEEPEEESSEEVDCSAFCSKRWYDGDGKEGWQKSDGRGPRHGGKGAGRGQNGAENRPPRNGSFKVETFKGTWQRGENGTWNGTFEREVVEGKWHRHNGSWNGTFERESMKGEWERSHNGTMNKSFERESGNGTWHRNPNGTWRSQYEDAKEKRHEGKGTHRGEEDRMPRGAGAGKPRCDCRKRHGAEDELEAAGTREMETRSGGSDASRGGSSGSSHDDGSDGFGNEALKDMPKAQTEFMASNSSSSNDQTNDGEGFGNAAVIGLAGAGIAAFSVALGFICCRRKGKVPLTSGAVMGKSIDDMAESNPGVVAGVVVNTV